MTASVRSFSGVPRDPLRLWQTLHSHPQAGFFLGAPTPDSILYFSAGEPSRIFSADVHRVPLELKKMGADVSGRGDAPRFVGFFGFDAGRAFDAGLARLPRLRDALGVPAMWFGDFPAVVKVDYKKNETTLFMREGDHISILKKNLLQNLGSLPESPLFAGSGTKFKSKSLREFIPMVRQAKAAISAGDIYQANLSLRFEAAFRQDPVAVYRRLCEKNPSPYACLLKFGNRWLISSSPELLVKVDGRRVVTRPIAGTRPRGKTSALDRRRRGQLLLSPKERAEHIMLVDLERNDLGRVCEPGSVRVTERCAIERYSHVMHIVSQVEGRLRRDRTSFDAFKALFPGGTITGCPKIESIRQIERVERISRGPFYGSAGFFCDNGDAVFNILIRTALVQNEKVFIQAGAGIVADSNPKREYREVLVKAAALREECA